MLSEVRWVVLTGILISLSFLPAIGQINLERHNIAVFDEGFWLVTKDFDGDGDEDIVAASAGPNGIKWYENNGSGSFSEHNVSSVAHDWWSVDAADLDGDGDMDIVAVAEADNLTTWFRQNANGSFTAQDIDTQSGEPHSVWAADLDDDNDNDILVGQWGDGDIVWWENDGDGNFSENTLDSSYPSVHRVITADLDNDGDEDIIATSASSTNWWRNDGGGSFTERPVAGNGGFGVSTFDIDQDGFLDIIRTQRQMRLDWFESNNGTSFGSAQTIKNILGESWSSTAGDFDSDGDIDVAAAAYVNKDANDTILGADYISAFENDGSNDFDEVTVETFGSASGQRPRIVSASDVDGDGDLDIVALITREDDLIWYEQPGSPIVVDSVRVVTPNGGESVEAGSAYQITWFSQGTVANVDILFSEDNGATWSTIASNETSDGSYDWTVPNTATTTALIQVVDSLNPEINDISDATFTINALSLTLTAPNGGETWFGNTSEAITWQSSGSIDNVMFEYSTDDTTWIEISPNTVNDGTFTWDIPNSINSNSMLVRVAGVGASEEVADTSDALFAISPTFIDVTFPDGGETWLAGSTGNILWSASSNIANVKIEYWLQGEGVWNEITALTPNNGSFEWTAPSLNQADAALIRISDADDGEPQDSSAATFGITVSTITLTSPNGGESWSAGSNQSVSWGTTGTLDNVKVEWSRDNGTTWNTVVASTPNTGSYAWTVPDSGSTMSLVRVSDADNGLPSDVSDAVFTVVGSALEVTSPSPGQTWYSSSVQNITWNSVGNVANVKLEYSIDNGNSWTVIVAATANDGSESWTVPLIQSSSARIRISDAVDGHPLDISEPFTLTPSTVTVTAPASGDTILARSTYTITWETIGVVDSVSVYYAIIVPGDPFPSIDSVFVTERTLNTGSIEWQVPDIEGQAYIGVRPFGGDPAFVGTGHFTIAKYSITVVSPNNGDENFLGGSTAIILWESHGSIANVNIDYSTDNGASWTAIASNLTNAGGYNWNVPNIHTTTALVRVSSTDGVAQDISDNVFRISSASITVSSPNGGETIGAGGTHIIMWQSTGLVDSVKIQFSVDGVSWETIISKTPDTGVYIWNVPGIVQSSTCRLRILDIKDDNIFDISDGFFTIIPIVDGVSVAQDGKNIPREFAIHQNYPNPFNPSTTIQFDLPKSAKVDITIFNYLGKVVSSLASATFTAGEYNLVWDAGNLPSGMYFYRIEATSPDGERFVQTKRLILLK
jgi:hypothetical protein